MNRSFKNTTIAILLACILTMAIGYAVLNTRLSIEGTSKITSEFNIQVVDIEEYGVQGLASTANMDYTPTSATYSTNLQAPGDQGMYEITIENKGTLGGFIQFETNTNASNPFKNEYELIIDGPISLGIAYVSTDKISNASSTSGLLGLEVDNLAYIAPGSKMYVYAVAYFDSNATTLPDKKEYSATINFDFYTKEYFGVEIPVSDKLLKAILEDNVIVDSGNGLYKTSINAKNNVYNYKSTSGSLINNYVSIYNKLWRIVGIYHSNNGIDESDEYFGYVLVEDETINNAKQVYSTIADNNGFYNSLYRYKSSLLSYIDTLSYRSQIFKHFRYKIYRYVENVGLTNESEDGTKYLIDANDLIINSANTNCSFETLTTGGCTSWLTDNGNTYLFNKIYSDESTNTGKIGYLQDGKLIKGDPQDTNYGEYKISTIIESIGCDFTITNATEADGSRENPYKVSTSESDYCPIYT